MGRPTNRYAARREQALVRMAADMALPPRAAGESHGAWYRRCAELWLATGSREPEQADEIRRLAALNGRREA